MNWARLLPPPGEEGITAWRWTIAAAVLLLLVNGLSGRGWVIPFGDYAYAEEMAEQAQKLDTILALQIAAAIRELRVEQCRSNDQTVGIIADTIESYQQQYYELRRERYPLPPCGEES